VNFDGETTWETYYRKTGKESLDKHKTKHREMGCEDQTRMGCNTSHDEISVSAKNICI
jgi:hypothetical protein